VDASVQGEQLAAPCRAKCRSERRLPHAAPEEHGRGRERLGDYRRRYVAGLGQRAHRTSRLSVSSNGNRAAGKRPGRILPRVGLVDRRNGPTASVQPLRRQMRCNRRRRMVTRIVG